MRDHYPQLAQTRDRTLDLLAREQRDFGRVVRRGLDRLAALDTGPGFEITGEDAFTLFTTHGMPADLIRDFAADRGGTVDERRFGELFAEHRELSRGPTADTGHYARSTPGPDLIASINASPTLFLGHHELISTAQVVALLGAHGPAETLAAGDSGFAVFDQTPFYAEGGGQVGDTGRITGSGLSARVTDTQNADGYYLHAVEVTDGALRAGRHR